MINLNLTKIKDYVCQPKQRIKTPDGDKFISKLKVGDIVIGEKGKNKILKIELIMKKWSYIAFNNGDFSFFKNQTVWVNDNWKHAYEIKIGDKVKDINGNLIAITDVRKINKYIPFYRLGVSGDHTYYINDILVHNASRYWVGGTGNWDATTTHWSASSGGAGGASIPASTDDVYIDLHSNEPSDMSFTVTTNSQAGCNNLNISFTGVSGNKVTFNFAYVSYFPIRGSLTLSNSDEVVISGSSTLRLQGDGIITTNGVSLTMPIQINNSNDITLGSALTSSSTITINYGCSLTLSGYDLTCSTLTNGGTIDLSSSTVNCTSWTNTGSVTATGSTINLSGSTFTGGSASYGTVEIIPTADLTISGSNTFTDLTITGDANYRNIKFSADQEISGTLTLTGNSISNRMAIISSTGGTAINITAATLVTQYTDWKDITALGAANWDLTDQAIDSFGDLGNNTNITFTTATDQHWTNTNGGNWSDAGNWTSRVPLPQDDVFMDCAFGTSKTVTADKAVLGKNIDWTGATWTTALTFTSSIANTMYGSLTLISGLTYTSVSYGLSIYGSDNITITGNGVTIGQSITIYDLGYTVTLGSDLILNAARTLTLSRGTLTAINGVNNYILNVGLLNTSSGTSLYLGSGTHILSGVSGSVFSCGGSVDAGTSTIKLTGSGTGAKSFSGGSNTYYNFWNATTGTGILSVYGSNIFNDFKIDAGRSMKFENGSTQTVETFTAVGTSGNLITLANVSGSTAFHLSKSSGMVICDYLNLSFSDATGGALWFAGSHSTNTIGNSGWRFVDLLTKELTESFVANANAVRTQFQELTDSLISSDDYAYLNGLFCNETVKAVQIFFAPFFVVLKEAVKVILTYSRVPGWHKVYTERVVMTPVLSYIRSLHNTYSETIKVISNKASLIGRTFSQRLVVIGNALKSTGRVLSESFSAVSNAIFTTARTFIESINIIEIYDRVITSYREFVENIKVIPSILRLTGRELAESIVMPADIIGTINTFNTVLTEFIIMTLNPIYEWIETQPIGNYTNSWQKVSCSKDGAVIIACDDDYHVYLSKDHGSTWNEVKPDGTNDYKYVAVACGSEGQFLLASNNNYETWLSTDGGDNWSPTYIDPSVDVLKKCLISGNGLMLAAIDISNNAYTSVDQGANWTKTEGLAIEDAAISDSGQYFFVSLIFLPTVNLIFYFPSVGDPYICYPGGESSGQWYNSVGISKDGSKAIVSINGKRIWISDDYGVTWTETRPAGDVNKEWTKVMISPDGNTLTAYILPGRLYVSRDFGATWQEQVPAGNSNQYWSDTAISDDGSQIEAMIYDGRFYILPESDGNVLFSLGRVFSEVLNAVSNIINVGVLNAILTEILTVGDSFLRSMAFVYNETINVIGQTLMQTSRTFTEVVKLIALSVEIIPSKLLKEVINVVDVLARQLIWTRTFTESVIMTWFKETFRSKVFTDRFVVRGIKTALTATKVLIERIIGVDTKAFRKTIHAVLTNVVKVVSSLARSGSRTFKETVKIFYGLLFSASRVFVESINVVIDFLAAYYLEFTEIVSVKSLSALQSFVIGKVLTETAKIKIIFTEGRQWIMSEIILAVDTISNQTSRIFTEIVAISGSLVRLIGRTLSQIVKMASIVAFEHTYYKTLSEAIKASGVALNRAGKTFSEVVSVIGAMVEMTIAKLLSEIVKISYFTQAIFTRLFEEVLSVADTAINTWVVIYTEIISVSATFVIDSISKLLSESIKVAGEISFALSRVLIESINVIDNIIRQSGKVLIESFNVISNFVIDTISKLLIESVKIIAEYSKAWTLSRVYSETLSVIDNISKQAGKIFSEVIKVINPAPIILFMLVIELSIKVSGQINRSMTRVYSEVIKVAANATKQMNLVFTAAITAASAMGNFVIGKLLIQTVIFKRAKSRLLLNGIQVGLWKKIARVTNGVWKKISRNDN